MSARRGAIAAFAVLAVIALVALAGCGAGSTEDGMIAPSVSTEQRAAGVVGGAPAGQEALSIADQAAGSADGAVVPTGPMIIRNASLELRVTKVNEALASLRSAVTKHDGEIAELNVSAGVSLDSPRSSASAAPSFASITIRVPATKLDQLTADLSDLGIVVSQSETSSDVTEQAVDMEARLKNLRAEEERLRTFLDRATKVSDLLEVQRELARVRGDIEAMDAQLTYLKRQVARATLQVTLSTPGPVVGPDSPWFGIREAFARGVQGAIVVIQALITVVIAALPLAAVVALVIWIIVTLARRSNRRRAHSAAQETDGVDEESR
jgi:hypothetical protein